MDRAKFFTSLRRRSSGVFGGSLSQAQVAGVEAILDAAAGLSLHHVANIMAQIYHETGGRFYPVRETFADSDAQAIARLDRAWARGQLTWVTTPYWRTGYFGRGFIQLTHKANYDKFGLTDPSQAMDLRNAARIAVNGMRDGMFTGKKLADYAFPAALSNPASSNPRRIVNGRDGTDAKVAGYHRAFEAALTAGGYQSPRAPSQKPPTSPRAPVTAPRPTPRPTGIMAAIVAFIRSLRGSP